MIVRNLLLLIASFYYCVVVASSSIPKSNNTNTSEKYNEYVSNWCPKGYHFFPRFETCRYGPPDSFETELDFESLHSCLYRNITNQTDLDAILYREYCANFSDHFLNCDKAVLHYDFYKIDESNKTLVNFHNDVELPLGDFYLEENTTSAIICRVSQFNGNVHEKCKPLRNLTDIEFEILANGTVHFAEPKISLGIQNFIFYNKNGTLKAACIPISQMLTECIDDGRLVGLYKKEFLIQNDWSLKDSYEVVPFDSYVLVGNGSKAGICLDYATTAEPVQRSSPGNKDEEYMKAAGSVIL